MFKRIALLTMATAALAALLAPVPASAAVVEENGQPVPAGTLLTVANEGDVWTTGSPFGTKTCEHMHFTGELTVNEGGTFTGVGVGGAETNYAEGCMLENETPITMTSPKLVHFHSEETGTGTLSLTYITDIGPVTCHYEGEGVFHYQLGSNTIELTHTVLISTTELCENEEPETEPLTFHGNFLLTTTDGRAVELN